MSSHGVLCTSAPLRFTGRREVARSKSSKAWLHEHVTDRYVRQAKQEGYRSV